MRTDDKGIVSAMHSHNVRFLLQFLHLYPALTYSYRWVSVKTLEINNLKP